MKHHPWWLLATLLNASVIAPAFGQDTALPWTVNSRVHVATGGGYAHKTVCYTCTVGEPLMRAGAKGTIVAGPGTDATWTFWQVKYDSAGIVGWTRQALLVMDTLAGTTPPPPVAVAKISLNIAGTMSLPVLGGTFQALATAFDSAGHVLTRPVTWRASAPAIASVDSTGLVTARGAGTDTIIATAGGQSAFFLVLAGPPPPPPPVVWSIRQGWLSSLALARPPCMVPVSPGTVTCGPYAVANDSTGFVTAHFTMIITVTP